MKTQNTILSLAAAACFMAGLYACEGSDRITGNEAEAHANIVDSSSAPVDATDTLVTGVSGNPNAVNAEGNAGNGSGLASGSLTEAERNKAQDQAPEKEATKKK